MTTLKMVPVRTNGLVTGLVATALLALTGCAKDSSATATPSTTQRTATTTSVAAAAPFDFSAVAAKMDSVIQAEGLAGAGLVIVDQRDGKVFEHYVGNIDAERISLVASASKVITAGVLMRLDDQEVLNIDEPVAKIADWGSAHPKITIAQLLSSSSGLVGLKGGPPYVPYLCQYVAAGSLQDCAKSIFTTTADDDEIIEPDTKFRYGGAQWQIAGAVAEIATGKSWAQLVDETYTQPCSLGTLEYNNHFTQMIGPEGPLRYPPQFNGDPATLKPTENPNMEGGVYTTAPDYAELLLMHLRGGTCGKNRVLSQAAVERMQQDRIGEVYQGATDDDEVAGYGLGWWVDRDSKYVEDAGAYGAVPWIDGDRNYGAYLIVESRYQDGGKVSDTLRPLIDQAIDSGRK